MLLGVTHRQGGADTLGLEETKVTCTLYPQQSLPFEQHWMIEIFLDSQGFQALRKKSPSTVKASVIALLRKYGRTSSKPLTSRIAQQFHHFKKVQINGCNAFLSISTDELIERTVAPSSVTNIFFASMQKSSSDSQSYSKPLQKRNLLLAVAHIWSCSSSAQSGVKSGFISLMSILLRIRLCC